MEIEATFSKNLRQKRCEMSMTQRALAERIGYSEKAISKWESGQALPPAAVLVALADTLKVSLDELLSYKGTPEYFLGIDGGATKTDFVLADVNGNVISTAQLGSTNVVDVGIDTVCERLGEGIRLVCGCVPLRAISVYAGLSGASAGNATQAVCAYLERFHFARVGCGNDATNIIAAGLGQQDGMSVIMGTGSVVFVQSKGELCRLGGYGYLFDEGGNGYAVGRDAIYAALRAEEGSGEHTLLRSLITARTATPTVLGALSSFYEGGKREIASYAPLVITAHEQGDSVAGKILENNMRCLAELICLGRKRLEAQSPTRVVLVGGLTRRADVLLPMLTKHLDDPGVYHITVFDEPAVKGALLLAGMPQANAKEIKPC